MENKRFKPKFDKLYYIPIAIVATLIIGEAIVFLILHEASAFIMIPIALFVSYFFFSPLAGFVELREETVFVKCGFFIKREIPYKSIRRIEKQRQIYSESIVSLKNALEHIDIRYNTFDVLTVSVVDNDALISELNSRISGARGGTSP